MNPHETIRKRHHLRRRLVAAFVTIVVATTLFVLTTIGMKERRLTIAVRGGVESVALKAIALRYSHEHNVAIEIVELPYEDLLDTEMKQLSVEHPKAKDTDYPLFDVIMLDDPWLHGLMTPPPVEQPTQSGTEESAGLRLLQLDVADPQQRRSSGVRLDLSGYFEPTLQVASVCSDRLSCGNYYALPIVGNSQLFAYRPSQLRATALKDWNSLTAAVRSGKSKRGVRYVARIGPGNSIVTDFMSILWANDDNSFKEDIYPSAPTPFVDTGKSAAALTQFKKIVGDNRVGSASFDDFDVTAYMEERCDAVGIVWSAWALMIQEEGSGRAHAVPHDCGKGDDDLTFTSVPSGIPELGAWLLAIPYNAPQKRLAREFLKEMNTVLSGDPFTGFKDDHPSDDDCSVIMALRLTPPVTDRMLRSLSDNVEWSACSGHARAYVDPDKMRKLLDAMGRSINHARPRPRSSKWHDIEKITGEHLQRVINGNGHQDFRKEVDQANEDIRNVVKRAPNPYPLLHQTRQSWFEKWIADVSDRVSGLFS
jgi:spermidine/putrescine-binding protein